MFPTFTGNSRRPRNVNLSGQRSDPFAGTSWGASPSTGASKTVAEAQADRQKRQQDRERLKAAQQIQRTWRGHQDRQALKASRRQVFDALYLQDPLRDLELEDRLLWAFPLLLAFFSARRDDDCERLAAFARDLLQNQLSVLAPAKTPPVRLRRLVRTLVAALSSSSKDHERRAVLLNTLVHLVERHPDAIVDHLDAYYTLLAKLLVDGPDVGEDSGELLQRAAALPLVGKSGQLDAFVPKAYQVFVSHFLSTPDMVFLEQNTTRFARDIDPERLSTAVVEVYSSGIAANAPKEKLLWLLAHFIGLQRAQPAGSQTSTYAKALYVQLSSLASEIRTRFAAHISRGSASVDIEEEQPSLPSYIATQLGFLVERREISNLLNKFAFNYAAASSRTAEEASILAGYILTLIRCFPSRGDDIRMRLYLADISGRADRLPSLRFFWNAVKTTTVFSRTISNEKAALNFLLQRTYFQSSPAVAKDSVWDREWRTVLLFLELYVFVLRLTDDEDFFAGFAGAFVGGKPSSRLSACSLPLEDLKNLTLFLKNLGFTLYYNAAELLRVDNEAGSSSSQSLDELINLTAASTKKGKGKASNREPPNFSVISGIDFEAFRTIVTTAIRMLYERDSRRPFLPAGHWLMTSRFDMDGFLSAVVLEEQRQHELGDGSDEEDADEDDEMEDVGSHQAFSWAGQRRSRHAMVEQFKARQKKQHRDRTMAMIGPKLEILRNMPFVIPFETRVMIFRQFVHLNKERRRKGHVDPDQWRHFVLGQNGDPLDPNAPGRGVIGRHHAKIRRGNVFEDAYEQFYDLGEGLKEPIQITFVDQFDTVEAGIDGGGVTKEFLTSVTMEAFTGSQHNLFVANKSNALYPSPYSLDQLQESLRRMGIAENSEEWNLQTQTLLEQYEFLGRIVGKCMYEGILIDIAFAGFFLLKWASAATDLGYRASINDLREMDEELYQGLLRLKNMEGDVSQLELDFTINDQISLPGESTVTVTRNLMPNGKDVTVTNENRPLYMSYVARHRLVAQPHQQTRAFLRGLGSIVDPAWLSMFNQSELQRLVGGDSSEIDVEDLRRNTVYSGLYQIGDDGREHPTIELFWRAMREFEDSERRDVLKYVTSTPRAPLLGFSQLSPQFSIRDGGSDSDRLPSASTCVNLLKLPQYPTLELLKTKLKYAISSNAGFDLS